ncbi:1-acyl-sn-glycerol-3-phosphate acyltransferase [Aeromicrobium sp. A1-2]|uniref:lysophospholipid acyltransferase family protein n=1 Tax=Aeromicrobium sp. A1-2 TaxID=2107713 RepID=UPI000E4D6642|nr:lysophospholipid acyltransferase family protein [Aeromicrobium sp. A1-2]AXT84571.1 1-acyl-sn-glycerol-3-phosphate acyltransferase [Aeromicrobium sp. A1-2]
MVRRPVPTTVRVIRFFLRPLLMLVTRRDWQGMEHLPDGGFVLAPNHISHLDPFLISHFMLDNGIAPQFLAKDTLVGAKGYGWILRSAEQIPVYRDTEGAAESLRAAATAVEAGRVVTIYPEGTITRDPAAWPMSGRTGAVRVALMTGRPLVPLMQWGPQEILWPYAKRVRLFPRATIHIRVGAPIDLTDFADQEVTEQVLHDATDRLMNTLSAMMSEVRGEVPSTPRIDVHTLGKPKTNYK